MSTFQDTLVSIGRDPEGWFRRHVARTEHVVVVTDHAKVAAVEIEEERIGITLFAKIIALDGSSKVIPEAGSVGAFSIAVMPCPEDFRDMYAEENEGIAVFHIREDGDAPFPSLEDQLIERDRGVRDQCMDQEVSRVVVLCRVLTPQDLERRDEEAQPRQIDRYI